MLLPLFVIVVIFRVADVIAKVVDVTTDCNCCIWQTLLPKWLMLLPIVCNSSFGRCYCQVADIVATDCNVAILADVVANVADVVATVGDSSPWQMLLPRWLMELPIMGCGVWQML